MPNRNIGGMVHDRGAWGMNFKEMNYILCIAKYPNLTKAAQQLCITQPTMTK